MRREAERTLYTLSTDYQANVSASDYEVIAIDNGSAEPLEAAMVYEFGPNFKYHFLETESVSPANAVNFGASSAESAFIAVIVDGARMVTPGLVRESLRALQSFDNPFVCALGWHLGPDVQRLAMVEGYDQQEEDRLLQSIDWRSNGYRLFQISTLAPSSGNGFLGGMPSECSWFALQRSVFIQMGGYDERFKSPGGGLVNHDFLNRVLLRQTFNPVVILGEGSFHQIHGGVATNSSPGNHPWEKFSQEYERVHGKTYEAESQAFIYYMGHMPYEARRFIWCDSKK